jgi:hypothetical protein
VRAPDPSYPTCGLLVFAKMPCHEDWLGDESVWRGKVLMMQSRVHVHWDQGPQAALVRGHGMLMSQVMPLAITR